MAKNTKDEKVISDEWEAGWEAHRRKQFTFALAATPAERLAWLEEMIALAYLSGALPKRRLPSTE